MNVKIPKPSERPIGRGEQGVHVVLKHNDNRRELLKRIEAKVMIVKGRPVVDYKDLDGKPKRYRAHRDNDGRLQIVLRPPTQRNDATVDGVRPAPGLWLIHAGRGRAYGQILRVARTGDVTWCGPYGEKVDTRAIAIIDGGYSYAAELPTNLAVLTKSGWVEPAAEPEVERRLAA